jgi:hypothetical protein
MARPEPVGAAGKNRAFCPRKRRRCPKNGPIRARERSWQKPRFLPAQTKAMSEKWPQAIFPINDPN